jgi:acyl transferase domain-containing protein/NAD(P)-dependent dehydrogenase (short-subunit alcohol dehydrogenase family)
MEPIAIVGIGCRLPGGVSSPEALWRLLADGVDAIREVPPDRWNAAAFFDADAGRAGKSISRWGGFVEQPIADFDALFFGIAPREAVQLSPMQRWLLEVTWEALEDAGIPPERLAGSATGVFVGAFTDDMPLLKLSADNRALIDAYTGAGSAMTLVAGRLSYVFDLRGPSFAVDTACSSSLVATHLACQSLWHGEVSLALVGGVNAMFRPDYMIAESKAGMLSPDGRSRGFDARANGYVRGEGAAVVVLKPLAAARRDGDRIYALIRGTASNHDGRSPGLTVPSRQAQEAVVREASARAGIDPAEIQYVEAHGTGTPVGDPIEAQALGAVLGAGRGPEDACWIGSIKSNVGHLEAAAGVAGLIKAALALAHRQIPPHLHFERPNPAIQLDELKLRVPRRLEPWPADGRPARAGVNSFGFGGSNAHVVLEEAPATPLDAPPDATSARGGGRAELVPLSAKTPAALRAVAERWAAALADGSEPLADVAWSAATRRGHLPCRQAFTASSRAELVEKLRAAVAGEDFAAASAPLPPAERPLVFVCSGMGPQRWGMGRQLFAEEPVYRQAIEECDALLRPLAGFSLIDELRGEEGASRMRETQVAQPAGFALQVALARLLASWGIEPAALVGHSAGEVAAAHLAGALDLEQAVRVIFHRSRLLQRTTGLGRMLAVALGHREARDAMNAMNAIHAVEAIEAIEAAGGVSIAAINSPRAVTLSGDAATLAQVAERLQSQGVFCRMLDVEVPYHSHYLEPLEDELLACLGDLAPRAACRVLASPVTGRPIAGGELVASFWWRNVREPVFFAGAIESLHAAGFRLFVELGAHPVLIGSINECLEHAGTRRIALGTLQRGEGERGALLAAAGRLYAAGCDLAWERIAPAGGHLVRLPTYPWQRESYWEESERSLADRLGQGGAGDWTVGEAAVHPLLGRRLRGTLPLWRCEVEIGSPHYLADHRIQGRTVFPGAAFVGMAVGAIQEAAQTGGRPLALADVRFARALFLNGDGAQPLAVSLEPGNGCVTIQSELDGGRGWVEHMRARWLTMPGREQAGRIERRELAGRMRRELPVAEAYRRFAEWGFEYGPTFRGLVRLQVGDGEALAQAEAPAAVAAECDGVWVHPALLDVAFQTLFGCVLAAAERDGGTTYLPVGAAEGSFYAPLGRRFWIHARLSEWSAAAVRGQVVLFAEDGAVLARLRDLEAVALEGRAPGSRQGGEVQLCEEEWQAAPPVASPAPAAGAGRWLVLADTGAAAAPVAAALVGRGEEVLAAVVGSALRLPAAGETGTFRPAEREDLRALLAAAAVPPPWRGVLYVTAGLQGPPLSGDRLAERIDGECVGLLHLVQALAQAPAKLWVVTHGAHALAADQQVDPVSTCLWGLGGSALHQELCHLAGGLVDLSREVTPADAEALASLLLAPPAEELLAVRGGQVLVRRLARRPWQPNRVPRPFRSDGAYLITGGLGGLGRTVARWLIERGARHLILLNRTPLPPRAEWSAGAAASPEASRVAEVRELEAAGATVHLAALDVADRAALAAFLAGYRREGWPPIRGVVHAAGVSRPRLLEQKTAQELREVLRPKVLGAWNLHQALAAEPLEVFVLFSSISSVLYMTGQGDYAAANAFLDGLAHARRLQGLAAQSICWGAWSEVGMAMQLDGEAYLDGRGFPAMTPGEGIEALAAVLTADPVQPLLTKADWATVARRHYPDGIARALIRPLLAADEAPPAAAVESSVLGELLAAADPAARRARLADHLAETAGRVMRLPKASLGHGQPLIGLGLESMMAIELQARLKATLQAAPLVVDLLQGASVASLVDQLLPQIESQADPELAAILSEISEISSELDQRSVAEIRAMLEGAAV